MKDQPGIGRVSVPNLPNGRVVRKVPAPFQRPSINIGGTPQVRREWRNVPAHALKAGDTIPGVGTLYRVQETLTTPPAGSDRTPDTIADQITWTVTVEGGLRHTRIYQGSETVWAFSSETEVADEPKMARDHRK
jgi:hypothetical protein